MRKEITENTIPEKELNLSRGKLIGRIVAVFLAAIIPFIMLASLTLFLPKCFDETFDAELAEKFALLNNEDRPKIIVLGGSSVAFGLDSKTLSEKTGYPVINFGLYAALGTKIMLDLSKSNINEGDIVVLTPEIENDTLSLFFNADETWRALDTDLSMIRYIGRDNYSDLAGKFISYAGDKWKYFALGNKPEVLKAAYTLEAFNEYGDIVYPRPKNTMGKRGYDKTNPIRLLPEIIDEEFIKYLKDYVEFCEKRGATVVFSYPPMNKDALIEGTTDESVAQFETFMKENIPCEIISSINDYLLDATLFYDTNFHLNDRGVPVRTEKLYEDLAARFSEIKKYLQVIK